MPWDICIHNPCSWVPFFPNLLLCLLVSEDLEHNNPTWKSNPGAMSAMGDRDCAHSEKLTYNVAQLNKNENHKTSEVWNKEGENGSCKQDKSEAVWLARNGIGSS